MRAAAACLECELGCPVTSDLDIYRAANVLIQKHGEDAPIHAAMRADEMLEAGGMEGKTAWVCIVKAVEELRQREPGDRAVH